MTLDPVLRTLWANERESQRKRKRKRPRERLTMKRFLAVVIPSGIVGLAVVFFLPFGEGLLNRIREPNIRRVLDNRAVQVLMVGFLVTLGISLFTTIFRALRLKGAN